MNGIARSITGLIDRFYFPFIRKIVPRQTFRYTVCGAANVVLSWVLYYTVFHWVVCERDIDLGFFVVSAHVASQMIVFPVILATGFLLNRYIAFKDSPLKGRTQLVRYIVSTLGSWAVNVAFLKLFVDVLNIWATPSFIMATLIVIVYSYLMQKYFTFRGSVDI